MMCRIIIISNSKSNKPMFITEWGINLRGRVLIYRELKGALVNLRGGYKFIGN
jgi:hypothetical protein